MKDRLGVNTGFIIGALHTERLWASLLSAAVAETITLPIDVAKTRAQLARNDIHRGVLTPRHLLRNMRSIVRTEGGTSLFRGLSPALMRQAVRPLHPILARRISSDNWPAKRPAHPIIAGDINSCI